MKTVVIKVDPQNPDSALMKPAADSLLRGDVVCFPTETVYGLGAVWDDEAAVARIYAVKGRPQDNPLIVHESSIERMKTYFANWDEVASVLTEAFCPGPFTLIMEHRPEITSAVTAVTAGLPTIGVRIPGNATAQRLIEMAGTGIAAPSANISGRPSPTTGEDALEDLDGLVPYLIDAGPCSVGVESTIVSWVDGKLELLRPGGISAEAIRKILEANHLAVDLQIPSPSDHEAPRAPGMKYRHYAPRARVHILSGSDAESKAKFLAKAASQHILGTYPAFYISESFRQEAENILADSGLVYEIITFAQDQSHKDAARGLFAAFRAFDRLHVTDIWAEEQPLGSYGAAYMNRLAKASGTQELTT